jgi:hypothetical protein
MAKHNTKQVAIKRAGSGRVIHTMPVAFYPKDTDETIANRGLAAFVILLSLDNERNYTAKVVNNV